MDITYKKPPFATLKDIKVLVHKCHYIPELDGGKLIAVCRGCGKWIAYDEIVKRINAQ